MITLELDDLNFVKPFYAKLVFAFADDSALDHLLQDWDIDNPDREAMEKAVQYVRAVIAKLPGKGDDLPQYIGEVELEDIVPLEGVKEVDPTGFSPFTDCTVVLREGKLVKQEIRLAFAALVQGGYEPFLASVGENRHAMFATIKPQS